MACLHRVRTERGHMTSGSMAKPSAVLSLAGPSDRQPILAQVAAAAVIPSVTVDHEKPLALTSSKVLFQVLEIHRRGTHPSHKAEASAIMDPEFKRYLGSTAVCLAREGARSKVAERPDGFLVTPLCAALVHTVICDFDAPMQSHPYVWRELTKETT